MIAQVADSNDADVIVIANRGRSPFKGALLGSVTQKLLEISPCPILVVAGSFAQGSRTRAGETSGRVRTS